MPEEWRDIPGYEGRYQVSNLGRVASLLHVERFIMRQNTHYKGHKIIFLMIEGVARRRKEFVHRLVALAFIPNPEGLPLVNHKDLNKQNNYVENLEWIDVSGNTQHYYDNRPKNPHADMAF